MLSSQPNHHLSKIPHQQHRHSPPTAPTRHHLGFNYKRLHVTPTFYSLQNHHTSTDTENSAISTGENTIFRTHNTRSPAPLIRHLSPQDKENPHGENHGNYLTLLKQDDEKLLEVSLLGKRTPQFSGSVNSSLPLVQSVFKGEKNNLDNEDKVDDEMLVKALEIRRKVTVKIFKEAMKKDKFGITYYENLVSQIPEFIDYVMIKSVYMKKFPKFSRASYNVRAEVFIEQCRVVPLIRWLKHNSLSYPHIGKLICASKGNLDTIIRLAEWLRSIHVKGRFIGVALKWAGENVLKRDIDELNEIVEFLEENGVRRDWMGHVVSRCPAILSFSMEELRSRAEFYLTMGMDKNDFGTMLFDCPKVIGYLSMEEMNQKSKTYDEDPLGFHQISPSYESCDTKGIWSYLKEFGLSSEDVGKLLAFKPQLMACSIEDRWKPLVRYFYYLGMSKGGMRRVLTMKPMVFCVDLEKTIVPKVQFLRDIGIKEDAIANMLARFPSLLTYSLYKKIRPVIIFLLTKAGVSQRDIGKVVALGPELLGCSIAKKLDHNVKYLLSLGISLQVLGEMISDFPMLLHYNIDILRPKYRYLRRTMVRPLEDLIEFPRFFSYSLEERIIPRHKIMVENRINYKLRDMLASTDEEFQMKVKEAVERRRRFESGAAA
ncbi:hypothetical protein OROGR_031623 [Orobanche gracilis]